MHPDSGKFFFEEIRNPMNMNPDTAWKLLNQTPIKMPLLSPHKAVSKNVVRCVCISDTHNRHSYLKHPIPNGDILFHAGDFTNMGNIEEVKRFNVFLGTLPHTHKIVIAGNHDIGLDPSAQKDFGIKSHVDDVRRALTNCTYLQDSSVNIDGLKIYGSPWVPKFGHWAFNLERGHQLLDKWNNIPEDTDVLLTHTPPVGYGDLIFRGKHVGCVDLLNTVQQRVKPRYHIFGHIHEGHGVWTDNTTVFVNCAICDVGFHPINAPIVFDIPKPDNGK